MLRAYYISAQELSGTILRANSIEEKSRDPQLRAKEARFRVEEALGVCLLPSLQLIPANPAVGQEIWNVLSMLPYEVLLQLLFHFSLLIVIRCIELNHAL